MPSTSQNVFIAEKYVVFSLEDLPCSKSSFNIVAKTFDQDLREHTVATIKIMIWLNFYQVLEANPSEVYHYH